MTEGASADGGDGAAHRSVMHASAVTVTPSGPVQLTTAAPASKSTTNRALLVAALADGDSVLAGPLDSDDTQAMCAAVAGLGATVTDVAEGLRIRGVAGRIAVAQAPIDARLSGTTMRFVTAAAALSADPVTVTGAPPLLRRPIGPLTTALRALGATVDDHDGRPPVTVFGGLNGGEVTIDASASSQFVSAVLLAAPYAEHTLTVTSVGPSAEAYIAMTVDLMRRWGATVDSVGASRWRVSPRGYQARAEEVEYDASAAAHLLSLAVATGGAVTVTNAAPNTLQPDARIVGVFADMGASVVTEERAVRVEGSATVRPVDVDLSAMPDQVTTVAALAALADGESRIRGAGVTRGHETDRLAALATELRKVGVAVEERPDGLVVRGGTARGPARLSTYDDHRLAMAFSVLGARIDGVTIEAPSCVAKTYPGWWDVVKGAGLGLTPVA